MSTITLSPDLISYVASLMPPRESVSMTDLAAHDFLAALLNAATTGGVVTLRTRKVEFAERLGANMACKGSSKIDAVKLLRSITDLDLRQSVEAIDGRTPYTLTLPYDRAHNILAMKAWSGDLTGADLFDVVE